MPCSRLVPVEGAPRGRTGSSLRGRSMLSFLAMPTPNSATQQAAPAHQANRYHRHLATRRDGKVRAPRHQLDLQRHSCDVIPVGPLSSSAGLSETAVVRIGQTTSTSADAYLSGNIAVLADPKHTATGAFAGQELDSSPDAGPGCACICDEYLSAPDDRAMRRHSVARTPWPFPMSRSEASVRRSSARRTIPSCGPLATVLLWRGP